jgi:hypothetical protein
LAEPSVFAGPFGVDCDMVVLVQNIYRAMVKERARQEEEFESHQAVFEWTYVDGVRVTIMRNGRLWKGDRTDGS